MSLRIPTSFATNLGKLNTINESTPGSIPSTSPAIRLGALGQEVELATGASGPAALDSGLYDSSIGTLYSGTYQYVQLDSVAVLGAVKGCAAFVSTIAKAGNYVVTTDSATAGTLLRFVGIFLNTVTIGNYCWIQTGGLGSLQFVTDVTNPVDGQLVKIVDQSGRGLGQQVAADISTPTIANLSAYVSTGLVAAELPVDNTITRVWMKPMVRLV